MDNDNNNISSQVSSLHRDVYFWFDRWITARNIAQENRIQIELRGKWLHRNGAETRAANRRQKDIKINFMEIYLLFFDFSLLLSLSLSSFSFSLFSSLFRAIFVCIVINMSLKRFKMAELCWQKDHFILLINHWDVLCVPFGWINTLNRCFGCDDEMEMKQRRISMLHIIYIGKD